MARRRSSTVWNGVEAITTPTEKQNSPGGLVLDIEKITMKLNKDIIIPDKTINKQEILTNMRNMKDIVQTERTG
jgi:hypothetical protein